MRGGIEVQGQAPDQEADRRPKQKLDVGALDQGRQGPLQHRSRGDAAALDTALSQCRLAAAPCHRGTQGYPDDQEPPHDRAMGDDEQRQRTHAREGRAHQERGQAHQDHYHQGHTVMW